MAIRVRCTGCSKKVSVDDAFAGGACRCPYCKEILLVGGSPVGATGSRPYAPVERPEAPDETPRDEAIDRPVEAREVPLAHRVRFQGVLVMVLLGLMLATVAGAIWLGIVFSGAGRDDGNLAPAPVPSVPPTPVPGAAPRPAPDMAPAPGLPRGGQPGTGPAVRGTIQPPAPAAEGASAAGIPITSPVIYVLDCGGSMKNVFDYARYMTRLSVLSLGTGGRFDILLSAEAGEKSLVGPGAGASGGGYRTGGPEGGAAAKTFLSVSPEGTCDIEKALEAAIARRPRTVVLLRGGAVSGAKDLADKAKAANVVIVAIGLAGDSDARESFSVLTGATGGRVQAFTEATLTNWVEQHPLPE